MTQLKAIIFDLDGTLVDSAEDLRNAANALLGEENLPPVSLEDIKAMIGDGVAKLVERAILRTSGEVAALPRLVGRFMQIYEADASRHTLAYPGVRGTLEALSRMGLRLAVVTNKPHAATIAILESLGLSAFFDAVIGGDTLAERKPHPAPIEAALRLLGIGGDAAFMVGDNYHDVQAARAAGIAVVVAVTYGYSHKPHAELGADHLIDTMPNLLPIVASRVAA